MLINSLGDYRICMLIFLWILSIMTMTHTVGELFFFCFFRSETNLMWESFEFIANSSQNVCIILPIPILGGWDILRLYWSKCSCFYSLWCEGPTRQRQERLVGVRRVVGSNKAFCALRDDGQCVCWGDETCGGLVPPHVEAELQGIRQRLGDQPQGPRINLKVPQGCQGHSKNTPKVSNLIRYS